jgi:hypothetical protein
VLNKQEAGDPEKWCPAIGFNHLEKSLKTISGYFSKQSYKQLSLLQNSPEESDCEAKKNHKYGHNILK